MTQVFVNCGIVGYVSSTMRILDEAVDENSAIINIQPIANVTD